MSGLLREKHSTPRSLLQYEVASALTRAVGHGAVSKEQAAEAWRLIQAIPIELHDLEDGYSVLEVAQELQQHAAYDAAYVALAIRLGAELWTLDGHLGRNAEQRNLPVRVLEPLAASTTDPVPGRLSADPRQPTRFMSEGNVRRARQLLNRLSRRDDYGQLLMTGQVIRSIDDIADPAMWRREIRQRARADKISVRTIEGQHIVCAVLNREATNEDMEDAVRWIQLAGNLANQARDLGHEPGRWIRDAEEAVTACETCDAPGYVQLRAGGNVIDGPLFHVRCSTA